MEVDPPTAATTVAAIIGVTTSISSMQVNTLKRSNSAPMINMLVASTTAAPLTTTVSAQARWEIKPLTHFFEYFFQRCHMFKIYPLVHVHVELYNNKTVMLL